MHFVFYMSLHGPMVHVYSHYCNDSMYCKISGKYIMARWVKTFVTSSNKEQNKYEAIVNYCERPPTTEN